MLADRYLLLVIRWLQLTTVTIKATVHLTLIERSHLGCFSGSDLNVWKGVRSPVSGQVAGTSWTAKTQTWADLGAGAERHATCHAGDFARPESAEAPGRAGWGRRQESIREAASQEGKPLLPQALLDHRPRLHAGSELAGPGAGDGDLNPRNTARRRRQGWPASQPRRPGP
ncbi:hypothetical protein NN561_012419 [Cricetulus griseus]